MSGSLNKVQLIGHLGRDPEVRSFQNGGKVVNLNVATSESWRDKASGERKERTEWHRVSITNEPLAKFAEQYLKKGSKVYLEGQLETRKWQDQSGADRFSTEVVLRPFHSTLISLDGRDSSGAGAGGESHGRYDRKEGDRSQYDQSPGTQGGDQQRSGMDDEIPF